MKSLANYAFVNAKVRGKLSKLLSRESLNDLMAALNYEACVNVLMETSYREVAQRLLPPVDAPRIEREFLNEELDVFLRIRDLLKGKPHDFVSLLLEKYDVERLKTVLRLWNKKAQDIHGFLEVRHRAIHDIPVEPILKAASLEEIILHLEGTPFKKPLFEALGKFKEKKNLFYVEMALDLDYYRRLWEAVGRLPQSDRKVASRLIGIAIDIENIKWITRFKKYYDMPAGEVPYYFIPYGYKVKWDLIRNVYTSPKIEDIFKGVSLKPYIGISSLLGSAETRIKLAMLENILWFVSVNEARHALGGFPFTIGTIMGFMTIKKADLRNVRTVLIGKLENIPRELIEQNVVKMSSR